MYQSKGFSAYGSTKLWYQHQVFRDELPEPYSLPFFALINYYSTSSSTDNCMLDFSALPLGRPSLGPHSPRNGLSKYCC